MKIKKKEINVVWMLEDSGAALEGFPINTAGIADRKAKKAFDELLNILELPDKVKNIFWTKDARGKEKFRFNGIEFTEDFFEKMYPFIKDDYFSEKEIIEEFCGNQEWKVKYGDLKDLLDMWSKKDNDKTIDFIKYHETTEIFLKLIPTMMEDGTLKFQQQYDEDICIVKEALYAYYKKQTLDIKDQCMQEIDKLSQYEKNLAEIIDLINSKCLNIDQKNIIMQAFAEYIDYSNNASEQFIQSIKYYRQICSKYDIEELDFEFYQHLWNKAWKIDKNVLRFISNCRIKRGR